MRRGWKLTALAVVVIAGSVATSLPESAQGVEYASVTISQLEENNLDGSSYFASQHPTTSLYPIQFVGVVVNKPSDMLDTSSQFQVDIQALSSGGTYSGYTVAPGDFGGAAVYMRKQIPWNPSQNYSDTAWADELTRIGASALNAGDVVLVQAKAPGMFYNGKYNINEQHKNSLDYDFSITILGQTTPTAVPITLSALKDSSNDFIFDYTRATGCEHYQGSLVHLDNLLLVNPGNWSLGGAVTVSQGDRTFDMMLGLDSGLLAFDPHSLATRPFSITAILDQESADYQAGYRLWLTSAANLSVPEPGSILLLATAAAIAIAFWRHRSAAS